MSLPNFTKRVLASTKPLLGDSYKEEVEPVPEVPIPAKRISEYTEARIKEGLYFVDHTLRNKRRQISPRALHCLTLYKNALKAILEKEYTDENERRELLCTIRLFENDIKANGFLHSTEDTNVLLIQRLSQLRRYGFAARYGDYFAGVCRDLKMQTELEQTQHFRRLVGWERYWSHINKEIESERRLWERYRRLDPEVEYDQVKTTWAILNVAQTMGIDFDRALRAVSQYSDHNSLIHASVTQLIEDGKWEALRDGLARDLVDLPLVTPPHLRGNIPVIQATIHAVLDQYFERHEIHQDEPVFWTPKLKVYEEAQARKEQGREKALADIEQERETIEKAAIERVKKLVREAERPERKSTYRRQKVAWLKLVKLSPTKWCEVGKNDYMNIAAPIGPEVWWNLALEEEAGEEEVCGLS